MRDTYVTWYVMIRDVSYGDVHFRFYLISQTKTLKQKNIDFNPPN